MIDLLEFGSVYGLALEKIATAPDAALQAQILFDAKEIAHQNSLVEGEDKNWPDANDYQYEAIRLAHAVLELEKRRVIERGLAQARQHEFVEDPRKGRDYSWLADVEM